MRSGRAAAWRAVGQAYAVAAGRGVGRAPRRLRATAAAQRVACGGARASRRRPRAAGYRRWPASGIVPAMTEPLAARIRDSRLASTAALLLSFALPFLWALSTRLVWELGKRVPGSVSDTSIALPSGLSLVTIVLVAWLIRFAALRSRVRSQRRAAWMADTLAVAAFCACFTWQFGRADWNPWPEPGSTNIFPLRFAVAVALGYAGSLCVATYLAPRAAAAESAKASA
ncbi:hypothetical protein [Lysobacter sp. yr284]|uniref:hypothetical protein n=1 Tax=Lysobacter sp. yr284 TaxID=1761791 RepID=UPI00158755AF|nr:hypothetical protein [Lysobacter sp. yr284]